MIRTFKKSIHTEHLMAHASLNASNLVMVFASNVQGSHNSGASLFAKTFRGAIEGLGEGLTGQSYALPIMQKVSGVSVLRPTEQIKSSIKALVRYADVRQDLLFQFTNVGNAIESLNHKELALLLGEEVPSNLILPGKLGNVHRSLNGKQPIANLVVWGNPSKRSLDDVENEVGRAIQKIRSKGFNQVRLIYSDIHKANSFFQTLARKNDILSMCVSFSERESKVLGVTANTMAWIGEFAVMVSHEVDAKNQSLVERAFKAQSVPVYDPCLVS